MAIARDPYPFYYIRGAVCKSRVLFPSPFVQSDSNSNRGISIRFSILPPFDVSTPPTREEKGGRGRESQFPERSHCNLRLKQRGGTIITDCMRDRRRGERERERQGGMISRRDVHTRARTCPRYVSACKSIVVVTANPRAPARRCLQKGRRRSSGWKEGENSDGILRGGED